MSRLYIIFIITSMLIACATVPEFDTTNIDLKLTPKQVIKNPVTARDKIVIWGGTILDTRNLKNETQIEVLAYPLNASHKPLTDQKPLGRFIILHSGYLEPKTYTQGKQLSVRATISGTRSGKIGETEYTYALVKAQKLHLWTKDDETKTFFHFGIGIQL